MRGLSARAQAQLMRISLSLPFHIPCCVSFFVSVSPRSATRHGAWKCNAGSIRGRYVSRPHRPSHCRGGTPLPAGIRVNQRNPQYHVPLLQAGTLAVGRTRHELFPFGFVLISPLESGKIELELELELIQTHKAQKPVLRVEVGARRRGYLWSTLHSQITFPFSQSPGAHQEQSS